MANAFRVDDIYRTELYTSDSMEMANSVISHSLLIYNKNAILVPRGETKLYKFQRSRLRDSRRIV